MTTLSYRVKVPKFSNLFCDEVIALGKTGATESMFAAHFGVGTDILQEWASRKPAFREALNIAMTASQAFHEKRLLESYDNKDANSSLITQFLRVNFSDKYKSSTDNSGIKAKQAAAEAVDYTAVVSDLIKQLKSA